MFLFWLFPQKVSGGREGATGNSGRWGWRAKPTVQNRAQRTKRGEEAGIAVSIEPGKETLSSRVGGCRYVE